MGALLAVGARYLVLYAARVIGRMRGWFDVPMTRALLPFVLLTALICAAFWLLDAWVVHDNTWLRPRNVAVVLVLLAFVRWLVRARTRVVVDDFVDYLRKPEGESAPGLSSLLVVELARLHELYKVVDEQRARPQAVSAQQRAYFDEDKDAVEQADSDPTLTNEQPLDAPAPIRAAEADDALRGAVSVEAKMSLGPVSIPVGALLALVGGLARGPRVVGTVHKVEGKLIVTARMVGDKGGHTWRVDDPPADREPLPEGQRQPEEMLDELAVRMFTELARPGSAKWKATWAHSNGLRAYRGCLRGRRDHRLKLREAERWFLAALAEDDEFDLAYHNLGIVATELGHLEAAESAFLEAINRNPSRWESYYGLAQLYCEQKRWNEMLPLCGRLLDLGRPRVQTYHLLALANRFLKNWPRALEYRKQAVRHGWSNLCAAALTGRPSEELCRLVATSLRNLGVVHGYEAKRLRRDVKGWRARVTFWAARAELRQAWSLHDSDGELFFELGKLNAAQERWREASQAFEQALQLEPNRARFLVHLARALAHQPGLAKEALDACRKALESPSQLRSSGFGRLRQSYDLLEQRRAALEQTAKRTDDEEKDLAVLRELNYEDRVAEVSELQSSQSPREPANHQGAHPEPDRNVIWTKAQEELEQGKADLEQGSREAAGRAATHLQRAADLLSRSYPHEGQRWDLYALIAKAENAAGRPEEAFRSAELAIRRNPLSATGRTELAQAYLAFGQYDLAMAAFELALLCDPDNPEMNFKMGEALLRASLASHDLERRRATLKQAGPRLQNALDLYEVQAVREEDIVGHSAAQSQMQTAKGLARYWLGRTYFECDEYENAITQFRIARVLRYEPPLVELQLGLALLRIGALALAEESFEQAIGAVEPTCLNPSMWGCTLGPPGDDKTPEEIRAEARLHLAASYIERNVRLESAIEIIDQVCAAIDQLRPGMQARCRATSADWRGWAYFKQGDIQAAIRSLTESIELEATPEAYLHLGMVHAQLASNTRRRADRLASATRAREFATLADRLGVAEEQSSPLRELLKRLAEPAPDATANGQHALQVARSL
jgi:tetratricopeptide (TPR) repeat protein